MATARVSATAVDGQAVAADGVAIQRDVEGREPRGLLDLDVRRARDRRAGSRRSRSAVAVMAVQVVAIDLDGDVAAHARDQFVEAHLDRLAELVGVARSAPSSLSSMRLDQRGLGLARVRPVLPGLEDHEGVGGVGRHGVGGDLGRAGLGIDVGRPRGRSRSPARSARCMRSDCSSEVDGMRRAWTAMSFSSSVGVNSWPRPVKTTSGGGEDRQPPPMHRPRTRHGPAQQRRVARPWSSAMAATSFSATLPRMSRAIMRRDEGQRQHEGGGQGQHQR